MKKILLNSNLFLGVPITLLFFLVGLFTLSHYGLNIDEPIHFERGNAYLDFFLTGRIDYTQEDFTHPRTSQWKYKPFDTAYFLKKDSGHPPLNDILAAATNRIFHEKLGILGDLEAYHLFELFVSSTLVFLIFVMTRNRYGTFAGVVAVMSIALYPLFYGESHFNIKDPIVATFFTYTLYFFYLGVEKVKGKYFFISSLFCALAFGTKFNIVFLPFILTPYFLLRRGIPFMQESNKLEKIKRIPKSVYLALFFYPIIVLVIHFASRPFLWSDPFNRFIQIVKYYKDIGTGINYQPEFIIYLVNIYPALFIGISTPIIILVFFAIGVCVALLKMKSEEDKFSFLMLLWFGITLLRVSLPNTSIYSGVRQIMEYIPAMAVIAGLGAVYVRNFFSKFINIHVVSFLIFVSFIPLIIALIKLHPNENLFMNSLIGGLKGATERGIPGAGETMGNAYLQGVWWLNEYAEKDARFGFPVGLGSNLPSQFVRSDIDFGGNFSGMKRSGEYMMEMFAVDYPIHKYTYDYLDRFLFPVYVKTVDDVPILKIWKNDIKYTKPGFIEEKEEEILIGKTENEFSLYLKLKNPAFVTRIEIEHDNKRCNPDVAGSYSYSPDGEEVFYYDDSPLNQGKYTASLQSEQKLVYFFPAVKAMWIHIVPYEVNSCLLKMSSAKVFSLRDIRP